MNFDFSGSLIGFTRFTILNTRESLTQTHTTSKFDTWKTENRDERCALIEKNLLRCFGWSGMGKHVGSACLDCFHVARFI